MADDVITSTPLPLFNESEEAAGATTSFYTSLGPGFCPETPGNVTDGGFYQTAQLVTGLFIYPAFCFPGLVGNILTVVVLSQRNMRNSTNAFLSALAVSDSIKLVNDSLYFFVTLFLRTDSVLGNLSYGYLYPYAHFIFNMSACVSSWLTVSVAVERYILVCHPTKARNIWTRKMAVGLCALVYIVMTSLAMPSAFRYRTTECFDKALNTSRLEVELTELWQNETFVTSYTWAQNLLRSIIPLFVLVTLNTCIIRAVRRTKVRKRKNNSRHRVTVMMIVVILTFLICITPDAILSTVFGRGYHEAGKVTKGIREITDTLLTINAAVNFVIYCALNRVFRKSFAHLCCPRKKQDSGWVTEMDESVYRRLSEAKTSIFSNNNHSNPRQDGSSPLRDASPLNSSPDKDSSCFASAPSSPTSPTFYAENVSNLSSSAGQENNSRSTGGSSSIGGSSQDGSSSSRPRTLPYHKNFSHPNRGSSQGLKRCRNSVKSNRGKRSSGGKTDDTVTPTPKETVTYIPASDCPAGVRGGFRRGHTPWKMDPSSSGGEQDDPSSNIMDSKSSSIDKNERATTTASDSNKIITSPTASSHPSSPLSVTDSPATTDSEVFSDDRRFNDITPLTDDVSVTSPTQSSNLKYTSGEEKKENDSSTQGGIAKDNDESIIDKDKDNGVDFSSTSPITTAEDSQSLKSNGTSNRAKKVLSVSFSDC